MARYSIRTINGHLINCRNMKFSSQQRGRAFEDLACYLFDMMPGVSITQRNQLNAFQNEEIDVAIWNDQVKQGLYFLPNIILVECKNWSKPVSSIEVSWFCNKLRSRGLDFGILIAHNGITGDPIDLSASHNIIAQHLAQKIQLIVITSQEIGALRDSKDLSNTIKLKLCKLAVSGRID